MSIEVEIQTLLVSPDTSLWLKQALESALLRDCVDVANDANVLLDLLDRRVAEMLDVALKTTDCLHG